MRLSTVIVLVCLKAACAWVAPKPSSPRVMPLNMVVESPDATRQISSPVGLTLDKLTAVLGGRGRALSCWECFRKGVNPSWYFSSADELTPEPRIAKLHNEGWSRSRLELQGPPLGWKTLLALKKMASLENDVAHLTHVSTSKDGTTKLLLKLVDGLEVETVIIPWSERERSTLCISSQVGCRQGCTFCATGRMGKLRSLSRDEILAQVYWANKVCRIDEIYPVDNIVFMGMGEPGDNTKEVVQATKTMVDHQMFGLASKRVTISTVGPNPEVFSELAEAPAVLAWSVHATRQEIRNALVPTTKHSMEELRSGLLTALEGRSRALNSTMLEITLLSGVNDSYEDAMALIDFCTPIKERVSKLVVNLIPWNNIGAPSGAASLFEQPSPESVAAFQKTLTENGVRCYIRTTRGDDESAACGQLATKKKKQAA
jgi:23S rRNA (adenine2503-C2)-methyltransferase